MPTRRRLPSRIIRAVCAAAALLLGAAVGSPATLAEEPAIRIKVVGGLADVSQYVRYERPFWTDRVPELTGGRVRAEIAPFDRSGIRGQEMLQLMRLGVVPFGTVHIGLASADEPELNAIDLPVLNPDIAALRRVAELWQPRMRSLLKERYGVELLAIYAYPAQVVFCRQPFSGLADLAGRRVRTSSVSQAELIAGLGATPVVLPFAETVAAVRNGVVECAVTAALSGNTIGLHQATTHISRMAINWGVTFFAANGASWAALPPDVRDQLQAGLRKLQTDIWDAAQRETEDGLACNAGRPDCAEGRRGTMKVVQERWEDEARRLQLLRDVVLPGWVQRCGRDCVVSWNRHLAPALGLWAEAD
jgi:TRAP-type C4-dicarboxylate transport system substrate-binding protein